MILKKLNIMKKKIVFLIASFSIVLATVLVYQPLNSAVKNLTKKYLFQTKYIKQIGNFNKALRLEIDSKDENIKNLSDELDKSNSFLSSMPEKLGFGLFYKIDNINFNLKDNDFLLKIFSDEFIKVKKASGAQSGASYIDTHENNIVVVSADGYFQYFNKSKLVEEEFKTKNSKK